MNNNDVKVRSKTAYIHTFLFAIYPVIGLYSINMKELVPGVIVVPLAVYLAAAVLLVAGFGFWYDYPEKGALMASAVFLTSTVLGQGIELVDRSIVGTYLLDEYNWVWVVFILALLYGLSRQVRKIQDVHKMTRAANVTAAALILFPLVSIGSFYRNNAKLFEQPQKPATLTSAALSSNRLPDIYYIILDGYARQDVLAEMYGYDNGPFVEDLKRLGFIVLPRARTNYSFTTQSLASSLNMRYIDELNKAPNQEVESLRLILENRIMTEMKTNGYQVIQFSSGWTVTGQVMPEADINFNCRSLNQYTVMLARTSVLRFFMGQPFYVASQRDILSYNLSKLKDIPRMPKRKFVFLHLVCPHPPFVFDRMGRLPDRNKAMRKLEADWLPKERYVDQLHYLNGKVMEAVRQIIQLSPTPPVIVIQGDHGPATDKLKALPTPETSKMRTSILNAYYLPGKGRELLYPTITPVNTFRLILNAYLGGKWPFLKDKTYYFGPIGGSPYTFIDVTNYP